MELIRCDAPFCSPEKQHSPKAAALLLEFRRISSHSGSDGRISSLSDDSVQWVHDTIEQLVSGKEE